MFYGEWDGAAVAQEMSDYLRSRGCLTIYNHPIWSRVREEDFADTDGLLGLEIFNYNTVNESGTGFDTTYWDAILRKGRQLYGFAINAGLTVMCKTLEDGLEYAEVELKGNETYVRIECSDVYGRTAWSNALFMNWP